MSEFSDGEAQSREKSLLSLIASEREEQRLAIMSRRKLTVVSAGAGAGKTHTLARRFAWLLATDPSCRVEQILTLTFTQLAANEMRERIRMTLRDWYNSDRDGLGHLRDALDRIDEAYISTIHSFALRVIRESGLDLDIDPGASLIGDAVEAEFWEDYRQNLQALSSGRLAQGLSDEWRGRVGEIMNSRQFLVLLNHFGADRLTKLAKDSGEVFGGMNGRPGDLFPFSGDKEDAAQRRIASSLSGEWQDVWRLWRGSIFPAIESELINEGENAFAVRVRELWLKWKDADGSAEEQRDFLCELVNAALSPLPGKSGLKSLIEDALGGKLADWKKAFKPLADISSTLFRSPPYSDGEARSRGMLLAVASIGWERWDATRASSGGLTFPDLVRYAAQILSGGYASNFRHVMVDEFQDTDGLQDAMISALASEAGSLFVVGDIKQSIYRFRHADPGLFADYIDRARRGEEESAVHIPLSCSYRMSGPMIDAVNRVFGHIWKNGVTGAAGGPSIRYEPLFAPTDAPWWSERSGDNGKTEGLAAPVEILLYKEAPDAASLSEPCPETPAPEPGCDGDPPQKLLMGEKRKALADALARRLLAMTGEGEPVWDKEGKRLRPMKLGDVAILVPTRTQYLILEESLEAAGIPAVFGSGREFFNRGETRDIVNLLRALDEPWDDYALAGWIESPFSGAPPGAALELMTLPDREGSPLWRAFSERRPMEASRFESLRRRARLSGPSMALFGLLEDPSWLAAYKAEVRLRVLANVRRGVEIARDYETSLGASLSACADYLGRAMRGGAPADEPDSLNLDSDFVQVKTIHASKGQEFPVVVLMGMETRVSQKNAGSAAVSRSLGVVAKYLPVTENLSGADNDGEKSAAQPRVIESVTAKWHSFLEELEEKEEKERLLYVAMTRARDRLICCSASDGTRGNSWIDWLLHANGTPGEKFPVTYVETPPKETRRPESRPIEPPASPLRAPARWEVSLAGVSATAYSLFMWCPAAYRMRFRQGRELKWRSEPGDGRGGADLGSLAHWVISIWDMSHGGLEPLLPENLPPDGADSRMPAFLRPTFAIKRNREVLREWLGKFAATDECEELRELISRGLLHRERAFSVSYSGARLTGSVDLFWEDGNGRHVRDWKITPSESAPDELYREQVNFYSLACRDRERNKPFDAGLVYLRPDKDRGPMFEVWSVDDWGPIERNISKVLKDAASGPYNPAAHRCPRCPFRSFCTASGNNGNSR
ncbi:MAG: UvrD-helicase domain-containing protein [Synergistaceae bacterium]|jgi:ATP-dependent exoDNAse (exonuclease V) beta subunit|nr:UvrD-helicase domain-containing protein [Synergistaceae bacterium]